MHILFCRVCVAVFGLLALTASAADRGEKALVFRIPVVPDIQRHLYLLENPAYLALALENNGMSPSLSSKPVLKGRNGFAIRNLEVTFSGKSATVYRYDSKLKFSVAGVATELGVPVEVDIAALTSGALTVKAHPPLAGAIPGFLLERVEFKLKIIADLARQRELVAYLDGLPQKPPASGLLDARLEAIITEAYNRGTTAVVSGKDMGTATPLAEQIGLILTLAIWLVAVPFVMFLRYRRNMRLLRASGSNTAP